MQPTCTVCSSFRLPHARTVKQNSLNLRQVFGTAYSTLQTTQTASFEKPRGPFNYELNSHMHRILTMTKQKRCENIKRTMQIIIDTAYAIPDASVKLTTAAWFVSSNSSTATSTSSTCATLRCSRYRTMQSSLTSGCRLVIATRLSTGARLACSVLLINGFSLIRRTA